MAVKLTLFLLFTLIFTSVLALLQQKIGWSFEKITLPQFGPTLGLLLLLLLYKDMEWAISIKVDQAILIKLILGICIPILLFLITYFIGKQFRVSLNINAQWKQLFPVMIFSMLLGAIGEELGWRSFLQAHFEQKYSLFLAAFLVGIIWGLWHIGHYKNGPIFMSGFLLFTISASLILAQILVGTNYNLLVSGFFHLSINCCFYLFFYQSMNDSKLMFINGLVWTVGVGIFTLLSKLFSF